MSHFSFLREEWPSIFEAADKAESFALSDSRTTCFYARRTLELAVQWAFRHDASLKHPYQGNISALLHEPTFKQAAGESVFIKAKLIVRLGNAAVHNNAVLPASDSLAAVRELFHVLFWFARTYARRERPNSALIFEPSLLPSGAVPAQTLAQVQNLENALKAKDEELAKAHAAKASLDEELAAVRAEIAKVKAAATAIPDDHDYSEEATRDLWIDMLLREAGWPLDEVRDREFEVAGMPNAKGVGYVDYVLWGNDGKPLGLIEAKRSRKDPRAGMQQAKLYADCLEKQFNQRPVIFYTNGHEHWIWDDTSSPPRSIQGFYKKGELELLIQRRQSRRPLAKTAIDKRLVDRYYQERAVRRVAESFEKDKERKTLLVMATGSGKTRTVIALTDLLMRCNWAKRILFLADRVSLVNQACKNFKAFLPDTAPVNLITDRATEGRVYLSTYPTMMNLIDEMQDGQKRFGVGHFDLVVIDEAHRSVYQKYGAIFRYFDSLLVGLTATPKEEIDRNTYGLFDLEDKVPTDAYTLNDAVKDGFLVPARSISVPLHFMREGIRYDELSEEEKAEWEEKDWSEDGSVPDQVESPALNQWLFNQDTVDKALKHLMIHGQKVAGGDRLGKTIIFARNQAHANFIQERFDANYPHLKGHFTRTITNEVKYAQSLIDAFEQPDGEPHIAISVDMLDTGIDIPSVVNLVFFKPVHSKTKFWQMVGRGTRLCPNLFGPDKHKQFFTIFDFCQNLEYFKESPPEIGGSNGISLSTRLFRTRMDLMGSLDELLVDDPAMPMAAGGNLSALLQLRGSLADRLHREVAGMNLGNFLVRPSHRLVELFAKADAWKCLTEIDREGLRKDVAGLPTDLEEEAEEAKRFDLLLMNLQLSVLKAEPGFGRLRDRVKEIAALLEAQSSIPAIRQQLGLIQSLQSDEWWEDVTVPMLEGARKRLRDLVQLIEKSRRKVVYTDFVDTIGDGEPVTLPDFEVEGFAKFRAKVQAFLHAHEEHVVIYKLRNNQQLTPTDLEELERILAENAGASASDLAKAKAESHSLGLFVRSLVGLDRRAAKEALGAFQAGKALTAAQTEFLDLIVNHLTEHGVMDASRLYESPFTDVAPSGPEQLFSPAELDSICAVLDEVRARAA